MSYSEIDHPGIAPLKRLGLKPQRKLDGELRDRIERVKGRLDRGQGDHGKDVTSKVGWSDVVSFTRGSREGRGRRRGVAYSKIKSSSKFHESLCTIEGIHKCPDFASAVQKVSAKRSVKTAVADLERIGMAVKRGIDKEPGQIVATVQKAVTHF
ncbi:hypothetical protein DOTSEDRAFT_20476 [Dothistroma septosporum NZE10]|uniref:Uncharacterized protein n=1 Tax=Dothistroma septosporum (strain NZE10 / CBS 128990) TaxID=675120 RepID=N1Q525_DOTSN|nr:hypothetical protein DOTSEDRAFT_20476 [Dothistroma septosporum NZE10]